MRRAAVSDSLVLAALVLVSALPYVGHLGLYSDDWWLLWTLRSAPDSSFPGLVDALMPQVTTRPVQGLTLAALFALFGAEPLGWHLFNIGLLAATVILFYLSLSRLGVPRFLAVAIPLVFGLLPHYSTDRVWIAAFQAGVAVALFFSSVYADLRFVDGRGISAWVWKALGWVALVGSVLAYEVTAVLFLVAVIVLWHAAGIRVGGDWRRLVGARTVTIAMNILFLALAIVYKMTTTERADVAGGYRYRVLRIFTEGVPVAFGELGLALPIRVVQALRDYPDGAALSAGLVVGLGTAGYLGRLPRSEGRHASGLGWPLMSAIGFVLFGAGYGVTLMTWEIGFHATGPNNRTAIGAAIGVAWVLVSVAGWVTSRLSSERLRSAAFAGLIGLLAAASTLVTDTVAGFWVRAAEAQEVAIDTMLRRLPSPPEGGKVLLDGLCPFEGPAPVFATGWDTSGMLRFTYADTTLLGDVVKPNTEATAEGIRTTLFDDVINVYPYGQDLIVLHLITGDTMTLASREIAAGYLEGASASSRAPCPPYTDGDGGLIF